MTVHRCLCVAALFATPALSGACSCEQESHASPAQAASAVAPIAAVASTAAVSTAATSAKAATLRGGPFLKGQLHAHTWGSLDSDAPPEVAARWYAARGFDFVVITDHNRVTPAPVGAPLLVLPGVELTINLRTCDPPPPNLRDTCLLHINALLPERPLSFEPWFPPERTLRRSALYGQELEEAMRMGAIAQLNHPNFHYATDAETIAALAAKGLAMLEIANESRDSRNEGDAQHPSTEALWDAVLSRGARVLGTATDDAHDYFDDSAEAARWPMAYTGDRGFVMVRAERSEASIRDALRRGDFYASNGLLLSRVDMAASEVALEAVSEEAVSFEAIGEGGRVLRSEKGRAMRFDPRTLGSPYVRVRATDSAGRRAWTQAVFIHAAPTSGAKGG